MSYFAQNIPILSNFCGDFPVFSYPCRGLPISQDWHKTGLLAWSGIFCTPSNTFSTENCWENLVNNKLIFKNSEYFLSNCPLAKFFFLHKFLTFLQTKVFLKSSVSRLCYWFDQKSTSTWCKCVWSLCRHCWSTGKVSGKLIFLCKDVTDVVNTVCTHSKSSERSCFEK